MPLENSDQNDNSSSLKYGKKETKPLTIRAKFDKAAYEDKLNEYYEKYFPAISRQAFEKTIIETLRSENLENV